MDGYVQGGVGPLMTDEWLEEMDDSSSVDSEIY